MTLVDNTTTTTMIYHENLLKRPQKSAFFRSATLPIRRKVGAKAIRLGGKKKKKGFMLMRLLKKAKLKWLKLQYTCMLQRLKSYYRTVVKDLIESGATLESLQQRILMETYFTVPVMSIAVAGVQSYR